MLSGELLLVGVWSLWDNGWFTPGWSVEWSRNCK